MLSEELYSEIKEVVASKSGLVCITGLEIPGASIRAPSIHTPDRPYYYLPERFCNINHQAAFVREHCESDPNMVVITQSAFIVSDFRKEQVVFIKDGKIAYVGEQTFGMSANSINMVLYGRQATIGDLAAATVESFHERLKKGEDPDTIIDQANETLGDSIEKVLLVKRALDLLEA